jgi:hypothetical protein
MRNASNRIVLSALAASLLLVPGIGVSFAQPVIVERAMPAPIVEAVLPVPRVGLAWVPGHWVWRERTWFWVKGHYVEGVVPPMPAPVVEVRPVAPSPNMSGCAAIGAGRARDGIGNLVPALSAPEVPLKIPSRKMAHLADRRQVMSIGGQAHWDHIYETKAGNELSWFQESPAISLDLIRVAGAKPGAAIIDIGGGESRLVDALLDEGFHSSTFPKERSRRPRPGSGQDPQKVAWITADVTAWEPSGTYDLWHDRAAFHFLTEAAGRQAYAERVTRAVRPGGHVVIGTFAPDGPERCSGLPVLRHDAASIGAVLGECFALVQSRRHDHVTPAGTTQRFQFSVFRRIH